MHICIYVLSNQAFIFSVLFEHLNNLSRLIPDTEPGKKEFFLPTDVIHAWSEGLLKRQEKNAIINCCLKLIQELQVNDLMQ